MSEAIFLSIRSAMRQVAFSAVNRAACGAGLLVLLVAMSQCRAQAPASAPTSAPDTLVLSDGDVLHGKLVNAAAGKVTFHSDSLGDVTLGWDKIKELHSSQKLAVVDTAVKLPKGKANAAQYPAGTIDVANQAVTVHPDAGAPPPAMPTKNAQYMMDVPELKKQIHAPGFFEAWNGAASAGLTLVTSTQNQFTTSGGIGLVRTSPTASWLAPRNRTSVNFNASYGKITQTGSPTIKTALYHADAERDEFFTPRLFGYGQTAFDHNYSQGLALQSAFGGGIGWVAYKKAASELDLKSTIQYANQQYIVTAPAAPTPSKNLVGAAINANYATKLKRVNFTQTATFIPSFNIPSDFSFIELDMLAFPAYKSLSFSVGTLDSYQNNVPVTTPATKPNSFQFTMGLTYAIKSK